MSIGQEEKLEEIDQSLQSIVPPSEWESKSISHPGSVGIVTPNTEVFDSAVKNMIENRQRNVESVLHDIEAIKDSNVFLKDELCRLKDLDEQLARLKILKEEEEQNLNGEKDVAISREMLDELIDRARREEEEIES